MGERILKGRRALGAETALRLARFFGTTPEYWKDLQTRHDLEAARDAVGKRIEAEVTPHPSRAKKPLRDLLPALAEFHATIPPLSKPSAELIREMRDEER